jgi:hypothetical protein
MNAKPDPADFNKTKNTKQQQSGNGGSKVAETKIANTAGEKQNEAGAASKEKQEHGEQENPREAHEG